MLPDLTKSFIVGSSTDTVGAKFFKLCIINLACSQPVHTRFDDLDLLFRSQVCWNHKLQTVF